MGNWTPSIVPDGRSQTVYLVLNDFGELGRSYLETSEDEADLETIISNMHPGGGATLPTGNNPGRQLKNATVLGLRTTLKF